MEVSKEIGKELDLDIKLEDGKVKIGVKADMKGVDVGLSVDLEPEYFINKLTAAIPGEVDNMLGQMLIAALKK